MIIAGILIPLLLMFISCLIIWKSATGFERASDFLGRKLSKGVKGATINAIASSMPEFLSSCFFLFYLQDVNGFSGGLGITAGSAIFNLLIIPALVVLIVLIKQPKNVIRISGPVLKRDGIVLIITIFILIIIIDQKALKPTHGFILLMAYIIYIFYMFFSMGTLNKNAENGMILEPDRQDNTLLYKLLSLKLEALIIRGRINNMNAWVLLLVSTVIMSFGTWLLVLGTDWLSSGFELFGVRFPGLNIPILFVAVILSAAASSIPDTIISIKDAKKSNYDDAISNALGSNIFDISFALGLPLFMYTLINGSIQMESHIVELSTELWVFLLVTTILGFVIFLVGKTLNKIKAVLLLIIYSFFILFVIGQAGHLSFIEKWSDGLLDFVDWVKGIM